MTIKHLFPDAWPTLNLDFANELALDPRITFSRSSVGTYVDKNGIIQYAAEEEPRFDYDPLTGESLGLLIEEARTNIIPNSLCSVSNGWGFGTNPVTDNAGTAPDGTTTATFVTPNSGSFNTPNIQRDLPTAGAYTNSVFVKPDGITQFTLNFQKYAETLNQSVVFDTTQSGIDGAGITPNSDNTENYLGATMKHYPNGWVRLSISVNIVGPDLNGIMQLKCSGDGVNSFYVWHWQTEEGSFPSSLIPTFGTAGGEDRAADECTIEGDNFSSWYNPNMGTLFLDMKRFPIETRHVFLCTAGGGYFISDQAGAMTLRNFQGKTYSFETIPTDCKIASSYLNGTGFNTSFNGSVAGAVSDTDTFAGTQLEIGGGSNAFTSSYRSGNSSLTVARIAYYPHPLSDEQLQALTS